MNDEYKPDIWRLQAQYDTGGLIEALSEDDPGIRKRAAAALRAMGAREAVPALRVAYVNEQDAAARASIGAALESLADERQLLQDDAGVESTPVNSRVTELLRELDSKDPETIIEAAKQLGDLGDKLAVEPMVLIFNDARQSIQVRLAVAEALLKLESAPVSVTLLANLRHPEWNTRRKAAAILGQLQAEWAVDPLAKALRDPHPVVRRTARAALKRIGTPEARKLLIREARARQKRKQGDDTRDTRKTPGAPSGGLLRHVQGAEDNETEAQPPETETTGAHNSPTQPLDPDVVDKARERFKQRMEKQKKQRRD